MIPAYVKNNPVPYVVGAVVLGAVAYIWIRGIKGAVKDVVNVGDAVVGGTVIGVTSAFGVPETSKSACAQAKLSGQTLTASAVCPAGEFMTYLWSGK